MARAKTSVDVDHDEATHVLTDDAPVTVERTEFSQAYRFASARTLTTTDEPSEEMQVSQSQYMKFIGLSSDGKVIVADRNGVEYSGETNILDRVI